MAKNNYWPKAFALSCLLHAAFLPWLGFWGDLAARQAPEQYLVLDLTAVSRSSGGGGGGGAAAGTVAPAPASQAVAAQRETVRPAPRSRPAAPVVVDQPQTPALPAPANVGDAAEAVFGAGAVSGGSGSGGAGAGTGTGSGSGTGPGSGSGSGGGSGSGHGSGVGGGSGPGVDGVIGAFLDAVESRKQYPYIARRMGQEGTVLLMVELSSGGDLNQVAIVESSGFAALDKAAVAVIRQVTPFRHGLGQPLAMKIPIKYRLLSN
ncbi:MAG: energy transducer TonB [Sporomusaceae bacterium]|nr:energy transducer TonB [Sporomusaceae bacterium]